jgi:predicted GNAT family acetyltransferase
MKVTRFTDPVAFEARVTPFLMQREAENNFFLGQIPQIKPDDGTLMLAVEEDAHVAAIAIMTPGRHMMLTTAPPAAVEAIATWLAEQHLTIPGIQSGRREIDQFSRLLVKLMRVSARPGMSLMIHQLTRVIPPRPAGGKLRAAGPQDVDRLIEFRKGFLSDVGETPDETGRPKMEAMIRDQRAVLWCDPNPVSCAACQGPTPNGIRIAFVYTPPQFRGRGYASNCVAAFSQQLLDSGRKFCFLYTDLANPTSNKIYREIGYEPVCESHQVFFDSPGPNR